MASKRSEVTKMTSNEAEAYILGLLEASRSLSTREIEESSRDSGLRCPDQTVLFLSKMKMKGLIDGAVSIERKGWIWSLPDRR